MFEQIWLENYCIHDLIKYMQRTLEIIQKVDQNLKMELQVEMAQLKYKEA